jgi:RNA polymerase sigma-70 factor (ECF subfamily)
VEEIDELTLRAARRGDRRAQALLVARYQGPVYALASRMMVGKGGQLADDLAQESMLKVLEALSRFDPNGPAKLSTWILTIATRTSIDALRSFKKVVALRGDAAEAERIAASRVDDPEVRAGGRELRQKVEAAMAALSDDQRAVLILRAYHDLDYPEIASALGLEEGTVKSRLSRARQALKDALESREVNHG